MCELLVGLPDVDVVGVDDPKPKWLVVVVAPRESRPLCGRCGTAAWVKDHREVDLVDLPAFDQQVILRVIRTRWRCPRSICGVGSWTIEHPEIAPAGHRLTTRAGRWATRQVGNHGRTVNEIAAELGTDWHTVNDAVMAYGEALLEADVDRIPTVRALSLDEALFKREGPWRTQCWSTQLVDARTGQLLDLVEGRDAASPAAWLAARDPDWVAAIRWGVLDLSGPYRSVFDTMCPDAGQVADPFHVIKLAGSKLDECRRRVQNETLGHRGRKGDPLYRCRRLLLKAEERLDPNGSAKLVGLLRAGDPRGEVAYAYHAKEAVRFFYDIGDPILAERYLRELADDLHDSEFPPEVRSLGRSLKRWMRQICNWKDPRSSIERTGRSDQQSRQTSQAGCLRIQTVPELSDPITALRRTTRLEPPRHHHTPLDSEVPVMG